MKRIKTFTFHQNTTTIKTESWREQLAFKCLNVMFNQDDLKPESSVERFSLIFLRLSARPPRASNHMQPNGTADVLICVHPNDCFPGPFCRFSASHVKVNAASKQALKVISVVWGPESSHARVTFRRSSFVPTFTRTSTLNNWHICLMCTLQVQWNQRRLSIMRIIPCSSPYKWDVRCGNFLQAKGTCSLHQGRSFSSPWHAANKAFIHFRCCAGTVCSVLSHQMWSVHQWKSQPHVLNTPGAAQ